MGGHSRQDDLLMRLKQCLGTIGGQSRDKLIGRKKQVRKESQNNSIQEWQTVGYITKNSNSKAQKIAQNRTVSSEVNKKFSKNNQKQNYRWQRDHKQIKHSERRIQVPSQKYCQQTEVEPYKFQKNVFEKYETKCRNKQYLQIPLFEAPLSRPAKYQPKKYEYIEKQNCQPKLRQFCFKSEMIDDDYCYNEEAYGRLGKERVSNRMIERKNQAVNVDTAQKLRKINELNDRINKRIESIVNNFGYKN